MSLSAVWKLSLHSFGVVRKIRSQAMPGRRFTRAGCLNLPRLELLEGRITPAVHDLTQGTTFATIQAAINAANAGDTILADAGVYAENVTVNKSLVLEGAQHGVDAQNGRPGAQESILDAATNTGKTLFNITASNVTIDGFTVQNATNANQFGFGILVGAGTSGTQLLNNIIQNNIAGISLANNSTSNQAVIQHNLIQNNNQPGPVTGTGIYSDQFSAGGTLADVLIDNNTFKGNSDAGLDFSSTDATKPATGITISNNLFDTNARGLLAFNLTSSSIRMNTFSNSTSNATADIRLFEGVNGVTITNNLLQNGAGRAVRISNSGTGAPDATNIQFNLNSIAGYTGPAGIFQVDNYSGALNATNNWWGSATGPTTPNNPGGTGQTLADPNNQVVFSPFLTDGTNISTGRGFQPVQADLALAKTGPATATAGTQVTYTLSLTNSGPSNAQGTTLTDTLPSGETFVSASEGSGAGTSFTDSIGTLAAGASRTITLVAAISPSDPAGTLTNSAKVTSTTFDANLANNAATFDTTVSTSADLAITKTSPGSVPPGILRGSIAEAEGFPITYTIAVTNNGPSDSQAVVVTDMLPAGVIFNSASFSQGTTSQSGNTITANLGTVASGATISGTIVVTPTEDGTIINTASVTSSTPDPNAQNNSATAQDAVAEGSILGQGTVVNGFERSPLINVTVGTFGHANALEPASEFSATIDWGDFISSPGTVTLSNGIYRVQGSHSYFDEHIYPVTVTVSEDNVTTVIHTSATILEELLPGGTRGTPNQRFVSEVYRDLLGRKVDAGGLAKWSAALDAGASQFQVITAIQNDSGHEFLKYEVDLLYQRYLQRSADSLGLNDGVNFLAAGGTQEQLAARLVASPEFNDRLTTGSNDSWLDQFYVRALHRGVDPVGRAGWDQAFAVGESRAQVAVAIFSSDEYRQVLVNDFYQFLLERPADQGGLSTWSGALRSGVRDEVVMASIMDTDSHEFFNKTAP